MNRVSEHITSIQQQIATIAATAGRDPSTVRLVAVSKTRPASDVLTAYQAGQTIFGENYVQELAVKAGEITVPVEWHFIGHLQSNKVRQIAGIVSMIHSVDRLSLAEEISRQWGKLGKVCRVLIQVNVAGESSKSGVSPEDAVALVKVVAKLPNLAIKGLMTMPPFFDDPEQARPFFAALKSLAESVRAENIPGVTMDELSMGMSGDFSAAILEGATLVRIGTAIFGQR